MTDGEAETLPVLLELLRRPDPKVRLLALSGLCELTEIAELSLPTIQEACEDADAEVRDMAQWAREWIKGERRKPAL